MNINRNLMFEFDNVANDNNLDTPTINTGNNINDIINVILENWLKK